MNPIEQISEQIGALVAKAEAINQGQVEFFLAMLQSDGMEEQAHLAGMNPEELEAFRGTLQAVKDFRDAIQPLIDMANKEEQK